MGLFSSIGDAFDNLNSAIDDLTGTDWIGDAVAFGGAIATGQWDEAVEQGLDLLEDGCYLVGWDEGAEWCKWGSDAVDMASDIYHGRYQEALREADRVFGKFSDSSVPGAPDVSANPTKEEKDAAAAYWTQDVLTNGTDGFMDALIRGNDSAKAALQNPEFLTILQAKMHEEQQLLSTITNLLENKNSVALGIIGNLRG